MGWLNTALLYVVLPLATSILGHYIVKGLGRVPGRLRDRRERADADREHLARQLSQGLRSARLQAAKLGLRAIHHLVSSTALWLVVVMMGLTMEVGEPPDLFTYLVMFPLFLIANWTVVSAYMFSLRQVRMLHRAQEWATWEESNDRERGIAPTPRSDLDR